MVSSSSVVGEFAEIMNSGIATYILPLAKPVTGFLTGLLLLAACSNDIQEIKAFEEPENLPVMKVRDLEVLYSDSAQLKVKVVAPRLLRFNTFEKPFTEFPDGIKVYFYDEGQKPESNLVADYALFNEKSDIWEARGNVIIVNQQGDVITTPEVYWDRRKALLYSEKEVRIKKKEETLHGIGFDADQNFNRYTIRKFSGVIQVDTETPQPAKTL
jgi:LPS export ABC transporter protein LptC